MRKVSGDEQVARLALEPDTDPFRRIVGLQIARGGEFREWVAQPPENFGRLPRPELAAVPYGGGPCGSRRRFCGAAFDVLPAEHGKRPTSIDLRADGLT